jgi:hypothetical protein
MSVADRTPRLLGAAALLAAGAIHVLLALDGYGTATLEDLFLVNGAVTALATAAVVLTRGLVAPLAGVAVAVGSLVALALSRVGDGVVGFRGTGLEPSPEVPLTIATEVIAAVALGVLAWRQRAALSELITRS